MGLQKLQNIIISPKGNYNAGRFNATMSNGSWPTAFAFGGWIYNCSVDVGFSTKPTEIKANIVLEIQGNSLTNYNFFDIRDADLKCDAGNGGDENLYDINFNGVVFSNFVLYDYEISIESSVKILTVTFKDYSIILDKIYVGLLKRQGDAFFYTANSTLSFPVICPDCILAGDSISMTSSANRPIAYGSYVGINGKIYDNFTNINPTGSIWNQWETLFASKPKTPNFDLNGGYLIIGTEDATEERCGDLAPMYYNFNQLLASLRLRGIHFEGAFPHASTDTDYYYKQNYIGSLREVMQQWCSDLGYDFYCSSKTFIGINLNQPIDISSIRNIVDPTTSVGSYFAANKDTAILSYKSSTSLDNTYKQSVITANNRPRDEKVSSKNPKRYVGILPLHPIDFNRHSDSPIIRYDALGSWFYDIAWTNNFEQGSHDLNKTLPELDGRIFKDIDTSIALSRYDSNLRDIYCQDRALYGETSAIQNANFSALGLVPLVELTDDLYPEAKSMCIEALVPDGQDEVSSLCLDKTFYRVFLGYYYPNFKQDVVNWEQAAAEGMYKYGIVTRGLLNHFPYMPEDSLHDFSSTSGIYGTQGTSFLRIKNSIQPDAKQYFVLRDAPFKDLVLYSGLMTPANLALPELPAIPFRTGLLPTGLFYATLNNEWGTSVEEFKRALSLNLTDPCVAEFSQYPDFTNITNNIPQKFQDWKLEYFTPKASPDLAKIWDTAQIALESLPTQTLYDRTVSRYYDLHYGLNQACSKLHIIVMTDTRNHPNFNISFTQKGSEYVNLPMIEQYFDREQEAITRRAQMETPTICTLPLLQEMCRNLLSGQFQMGPTGNPKFGCVIDEDKWNYLEEGFTYPQLTRPNSRGLTVNIVKNPINNSNIDNTQMIYNSTDVNGDFYYSDVINDFLLLSPASLTYTIVYPVSSIVNNSQPNITLPPIYEESTDPGENADVIFGLGGYYRGILSSQVDIDNRTPEINDIYGAPVNSANNPAAGFKVINNPVDVDLQPLLDPFSQRYFSWMTVITGDANILTTVSQYHDKVAQLNNYELTTPWKTVQLSLAGGPQNFGNFTGYLTPNSGLIKMSMSVESNGLITNIEFSDRAKKLPIQDSLLNKLIFRLNK